MPPTLAKLLDDARKTREAFAIDGLRDQETRMYRDDEIKPLLTPDIWKTIDETLEWSRDAIDLLSAIPRSGYVEAISTEPYTPKLCIWCHGRHVEYLTCAEAANVG